MVSLKEFVMICPCVEEDKERIRKAQGGTVLRAHIQFTQPSPEWKEPFIGGAFGRGLRRTTG